MSALAPMRDEAPLQPEPESLPVTDEKHRPRAKPIMNAGTGL
jgi:two-component system cell cycle sensor histidine kinase PleC